MVNTNIQSPIPLMGRGKVYKTFDKYTSGEYRELRNCELLDESIVSRRSISSLATVGTPILEPLGWAGVVEGRAIAVSKTQQISYAQTTSSPSGTFNAVLWAPTNLPIPLPTATSFHVIRGVFKYNNRYYWLTHEYDSDDTTYGTHRICLYHAASSLGTGIGISAVTFAALTRVVIITNNESGFKYNNWFIFKDRLWVSTNKALYFGKATDPLIFAAPSGGFFKVPDQTQTYALGIRDSVYILHEQSTHLLTYSSDPNLDSSLRPVSANIGGSSACIFEDKFYYVNLEGLFVVDGNSVQMVLPGTDVEFFWRNPRLTSFGDYIILLFASLPISYELYTRPRDNENIPQYWGNYGWTPMDTNTVAVLNMKTGAISTWDFLDHRDLVAAQRGAIVDLIPGANFDDDNSLFILTSAKTSTRQGFAYYMSHTRDPQFTNPTDLVCSSTGVTTRYKPNVLIEIPKFTPDGTEFLIKKFRFLELMGFVFHVDFQVQVSYFNDGFGVPQYGPAVNISTGNINDLRPDINPIRVPLNQRARSLSFKFSIANPDVAVPAGFAQSTLLLSINYIRLLWSYTSRSPVNKITQ